MPGKKIQDNCSNVNYDACLVLDALRQDDYKVKPDGMKTVQTVSHSWMLWQVEVRILLGVLLAIRSLFALHST